MTTAAAPTARHEATALEVVVTGRWDALDLSELLVPFHSFLVQETRDRWIVHARAPGCHGEPLDDALRAIDEWRGERRLDAALQVSARPRDEPW